MLFVLLILLFLYSFLMVPYMVKKASDYYEYGEDVDGVDRRYIHKPLGEFIVYFVYNSHLIFKKRKPETKNLLKLYAGIWFGIYRFIFSVFFLIFKWMFDVVATIIFGIICLVRGDK